MSLEDQHAHTWLSLWVIQFYNHSVPQCIRVRCITPATTACENMQVYLIVKFPFLKYHDLV